MSPPMRGVNLLKLMKLLDLLGKPTGATYAEMVDELGVNIRTVYRMLDVIDALGFPIVEEKVAGDNRKRKKLLESFRKKLPNMTVPEITFSPSELFALALLKSEESVLRDTELGHALDRVFSRLELIMPSRLYEKLGKIRSLFVRKGTGGKNHAGTEKIIEELFNAILALRCCSITYHAFSTGMVKTYEIAPLQFFEHQGGLYLFARVIKYGDIRILAIERLSKIELLPDLFEYPKDFDAEAHLNSAFGLTLDDEIEVTVRFSAGQARYIKERPWAAKQKITTRPDGSIILWLQTSGWWDVKRWVLSFGVEAEVLEPLELREEIKRELEETRRLY